MPASASTELTSRHQQLLLQLARAAIAAGPEGAPHVPIAAIDERRLQQSTATFVTLYRRQQLRGCIGSLLARRSLLADVCENARAAAFYDPRFSPVRTDELTELLIEISTLSDMHILAAVESDAALLTLLRPGVDGVVIEQAGRRATYLPKVWSHFADGEAFLASLREKAGLPIGFDATATYRIYQVQVFSECE